MSHCRTNVLTTIIRYDFQHMFFMIHKLDLAEHPPRILEPIMTKLIHLLPVIMLNTIQKMKSNSHAALGIFYHEELTYLTGLHNFRNAIAINAIITESKNNVNIFIFNENSAHQELHFWDLLGPANNRWFLILIKKTGCIDFLNFL